MLEKRSVSLAGHRTSIALEPEFWVALASIAVDRETTLLALILQVDSARLPEQKLASALRVFVLQNK